MLQTSIYRPFLIVLLLFALKSDGSPINDVIFGANTDNAACISLKNNYQFDFAFNQMVKGHEGKNYYNHFLVSEGRYLKLNIPFSSTSTSHVHPSIATSGSKTTQSHKDPRAPFLERVELAAKDDFKSLKYDLGFSIQSPTEKDDKMTKYCVLKLDTFALNCVKMHHFSGRNFGDPQAFADLSSTKMRLPVDFLPSVIFHPVEYDEYPNSRYAMVFLEQRLEQDNETRKWSYVRRFQTYNFVNIHNTVNLTRTIALPDMFKKLPNDLEITGIFSWKDDKGFHYLMTAFNGSDHLYCYDHDCQSKAQYKPFLEHCKPRSSKVSIDGRPLQLIDQWSKTDVENREEVEDEEQAMERQIELREAISFVWRMTILVSGITIVILIISIFYYFVKESMINQKRQVQLEQAREAKSSMETLSSHGSSCSPLLMNKVTAEEQHPL